MSTFALDLSKFGAKAIGNAEHVARKIGLDMHSGIVEEMPYDTGRARANTGIAIGGNPGTSTMETDKTGAATKARAESSIQAFKLGDSITIYNNVEYIMPLEYGHSQQAPAGMFRVTFNRVASKVGAYAAEVNR